MYKCFCPFDFERSQSQNDFWQFWGLCDAEQPPISGNNPAPSMSASKLQCRPQKSSSGLKLTVWLLQPPFNSFESDTLVAYIYFSIIFHPKQQRNVQKQ